ncbi:MAG: hypothetical protein K2K21_03810 [Lachnospiraceae bacterium]|nr:hypothetical protein [Lachnospiraceae bacterium]
MNVTMLNAVSNKGGSLFAGNLPMMQKPALKSTQEKIERQQKAAGQIQFLENQKEKLKNMECSTVEDIANKLEKFHSYEDEIASVKMQYNQEQMWHIMDEAKERGEKIAEAVEKMKPKTAEERREDMVEEALGIDDEKGALSESLEELSELAGELTEEVTEVDLNEELSRESPESADDLSDVVSENALKQEQFPLQPDKYKRFDLLI